MYVPRLQLQACVTVLTASFQPVGYGFEAVLMNEFHALSGTCSMLVPSGPGYENVSLAN
jgi:ATP-binding cassette, subfamily G (WHITE), member 2, SNQ2